MTCKIVTYQDGMLHILRNPHGFTEEVIREARCAAADRIEELERRFSDAQDRANAISVKHGEAWNLARELFTRLKDNPLLTPEEIDAYDLRIYGKGRPVPPHATGPTMNTTLRESGSR